MAYSDKVKQFFNSLIGLEIDDALKKLGYWWTLENCDVNAWRGSYSFYRAAGGQLELKTKDNFVINEWHNFNAELLQKNDLC
jgi:hypothetical protein